MWIQRSYTRLLGEKSGKTRNRVVCLAANTRSNFLIELEFIKKASAHERGFLLFLST